MTEEKKEYRLYSTEFAKKKPAYVDGLDMYKYLSGIMKSDDKDEIILALMQQVCMLSHFVATKHPDYAEFIGKVNTREVKNDDLLKFDLMTDEELAQGIIETYDVSNEPKTQKDVNNVGEW